MWRSTRGRGRGRGCCWIANWRGFEGRGDLVAALESQSGAEDQRQGAELQGDRIRQQRSQDSACRTHRSLVILELGASDDRRNEWILHGYSGDSWFYDEPIAAQAFRCSTLSAPSTTSTVTSHSHSFREMCVLGFDRLVCALIGAETEAKHLQKQLKKTASFSVKGKKQLQRKSNVVLLNETLVTGTWFRH